MAENINNPLNQNFSGKFGKDFVYRTTKTGKTFITKYPDRSKVKLSAKQRESNSRWKKAVAFGQAVIADPVMNSEMEKKLYANKNTRYHSVYQACVQQYMEETNPANRLRKAKELVQNYCAAFALTDRQVQALEVLAMEEELSNLIYQDLNKVSKPTATRDLQDLVNRGILAVSGRGAGVKYTLLPLPGSDQPPQD